MPFQCDHCGAPIDRSKNPSSSVCQYCGTPFQTVVNPLALDQLLKRGELALEDGEFNKAFGLYEKALDFDCQCARAYIGQLQALLKLKTQDELGEVPPEVCRVGETSQFKRALQFASPEYQKQLEGYLKQLEETAALLKNTALYLAAQHDFEQNTLGGFTKALPIFTDLDDFIDSQEKATICRTKIQALTKQLQEEQAWKTRNDNRVLLFAVLCLFLAIVGYVIYTLFFQFPREKLLATTLFEQQEYAQAIAVAKASRKPEELAELIAAATQLHTKQYYNQAAEMEKKQFYSRAWLMYMEIQDYADARARADALRPFAQSVRVTGGNTLSLRSDGRISVTRRLDDGSTQTTDVAHDAVYFSVDGDKMIVIHEDGSIKSTKLQRSDEETLNLLSQTDLVAVEFADIYLVGLRSDGSMITTIPYKDVSTQLPLWRNIKSFYVDGTDVFGVTHDGKVRSTSDGSKTQQEISTWDNIVMVAARHNYIIGLRSDGTVQVPQEKGGSWLDWVKNMSNVSAIAADSDALYLLTTDGRLWKLEKDYSSRTLEEVISGCVTLFPSQDNTTWVAVMEDGTTYSRPHRSLNKDLRVFPVGIGIE